MKTPLLTLRWDGDTGDGKAAFVVADQNDGWKDLRIEVDTDDCDREHAKAMMQLVIDRVNAHAAAPTRAIINDGGPAFPYAFQHEDDTRFTSGGFAPGMSLRDWFAGQALAGFAHAENKNAPVQDYAGYAYSIADAMLAHRRVAHVDHVTEERDNYKRVVEETHAAIDACELMTPRSISHGGLRERVEKLIQISLAKRGGVS